MKRLSTRIVVTHLAVAVIAAAATFAVVRLLAPALFDESLRRAQMMGDGTMRGRPGWAGMLREQIASDVTLALLIGAVVAVVVAAGFGVWFALHLVRPLAGLRRATHALASGRYDVSVPTPSETELADLARDVQTLGTSLAETETRRMRLLGEVAHELRTPLTVIDGTIEAMIDGVLPASPEALVGISDEVRRMRRLSDDLSALSRAEEGRLSITPGSMDLGETVARAAERLRPQASDAGLSLDVTASETPLIVQADRDRIAQVVTNLVGNAIRATPAGGDIRVTVRAAADRAEIVVADTGVGIAADEVERVFERFYRASGAKALGEAGSGIGLTIARQLMRAHGGDVTAASPGRGAGATFVAWLPID